jgi:ABC-2 type transport system ATP-binding protein
MSGSPPNSSLLPPPPRTGRRPGASPAADRRPLGRSSRRARRWVRPLHIAALIAAVPAGLVLGPDGAGLIVGVFVLVVPFEKLFRRHAYRIRRPGLRTDLSYALVSPILNLVGLVAGVAIAVVALPGSTAVLGANGSGKSTLCRLVATVAAAQTGTVRIGGLDPGDPEQRIAIRRRLGYQTQSGALPSRMRVDAFCDYVGALKEIDSGRARRRWTHWVLDRVGLADVAHQHVRSLSGGMQRRLALAQALIGQPDLLVPDEPLTSLDSDQRRRVVAMVEDRAAEGTVIVATHHVDELAGVCDRAVVLHRSMVVFSGSPSELADQARGAVWETEDATPAPNHRSVGPGPYRCVGQPPPGGATPVEPSVQDGYIVVVGRAEASFPTATRHRSAGGPD